MKNNYLLIIVLVVVAAGVGFFGGMQYQKSQSPSFTGQFGNPIGNVGGNIQLNNGQFRPGERNGGNNVRGGFQPVNGEIIAADEKSITVKLQDGSSKIVLLSEKTQINKAETVDKSELKSGVKVAVFGTENSDGSVSAQNVQINPILRNQ